MTTVQPDRERLQWWKKAEKETLDVVPTAHHEAAAVWVLNYLKIDQEEIRKQNLEGRVARMLPTFVKYCRSSTVLDGAKGPVVAKDHALSVFCVMMVALCEALCRGVTRDELQSMLTELLKMMPDLREASGVEI